MSYSYATAKAILSEVEKDRILAMYLSSDDMNDAYGAASVDSMKVSYRNSLKKIEKAGGKTGAQNEDEDEEETTKSPKKAGRPRKTPVKSTTKTAMSKTLGGHEDAAATNVNVVSDNIKPDQEDEQTSEMIKEEDESEC
ncbi:unnamed protein product [Aureobasidium uvarum]|uniref:Uncharacterized protein n=1 Tax=Aureobasidium uvarum TaxID=2773716 RepID=A0A9N8KRJ0_9PEZI|nr:unnamed protein product [Aureobasidium uvarum]